MPDAMPYARLGEGQSRGLSADASRIRNIVTGEVKRVWVYVFRGGRRIKVKIYRTIRRKLNDELLSGAIAERHIQLMSQTAVPV